MMYLFSAWLGGAVGYLAAVLMFAARDD